MSRARGTAPVVGLRTVGFRDLQRELVELADRAGDPTPALRSIAQLFREAQAENFRRGGRPRWKALNAEYAARKARQGKGTQIGVWSGGLRDSLTQASHPYNLEVVLPDRLRMGTSNPVANLFGGKHTVHQQPRRKVFVLTPAMRRQYLQIVQDFLSTGELP